MVEWKEKLPLVAEVYMVGNTPGPIGNPIKYHPIINKIHVKEISKKYGVINEKALLMVYGFSLFRL